jgi:hypothetical protein
MPNTRRETVEWTQEDSDLEIFKDSFQTLVNVEQKQACYNTGRNNCNVRNMKSPNLSNMSTPQNSSQHGLAILNKDISNLFSPTSIPDLQQIFSTTNLPTTTCKSQIKINTRNKELAQATEKEENNLEKELLSAILQEGIMNDKKKEQERSKKTCKKHVMFSNSPTNKTVETNISINSGDELLLKNINANIQNENTADNIMVRFTHGFTSVMEHLYNFASSKFSSAISETWEATATAYKNANVKYIGPKPRSSLQSHVNRIASKRKLLQPYVDETESAMKTVKRSCQSSAVQSNDAGKLYASSYTHFSTHDSLWDVSKYDQ